MQKYVNCYGSIVARNKNENLIATLVNGCRGPVWPAAGCCCTVPSYFGALGRFELKPQHIHEHVGKRRDGKEQTDALLLAAKLIS